jgi:hypothetical protein
MADAERNRRQAVNAALNLAIDMRTGNADFLRVHAQLGTAFASLEESAKALLKDDGNVPVITHARTDRYRAALDDTMALTGGIAQCNDAAADDIAAARELQSLLISIKQP